MQASTNKISLFPLGHPAGAERTFDSPAHEEARARLDFLVDHHRRSGILLGQSGTGKTTLLQQFAQIRRRQACQVATVDAAVCDSHDLLWQLAAQWGANPRTSDLTFQLWRQINDRLAALQIQQTTHLLIVDNADQATTGAIDLLTRLVRNVPADDSHFTLVLAACPDRLGQLGSGLLQQIALRIDLSPWDEADTIAYLNSTLGGESGDDAAGFEIDALRRVHELTGGVPRQVNLLADLARVAGGLNGEVDSGTVDAAYQELSLLGTQS